MSSNASKKIKLEITWECVLSALKHETIVDVRVKRSLVKIYNSCVLLVIFLKRAARFC